MVFQVQDKTVEKDLSEPLIPTQYGKQEIKILVSLQCIHTATLTITEDKVV